jgi:hypothetical protein
LDENSLLTEAASQDEELRRVAVLGNASFKTSYGMRGQRRRYEKTSRFEVEGYIHRRSNLLINTLVACTLAAL